MVVKLHLFSGFENKKLGITPDMELGHLYEDTNSWAILCFAAEKVGAKQEWAQSEKETGLLHFDLWGNPLKRAKALFTIVSDDELVKDMETMRKGG